MINNNPVYWLKRAMRSEWQNVRFKKRNIGIYLFPSGIDFFGGRYPSCHPQFVFGCGGLGWGPAVVRRRSRQCPGTKPCVYFLRCFSPGFVRTLKLYVDSEKGFTAIRIRLVANGCKFLKFRECEWVLMNFKIFKPYSERADNNQHNEGRRVRRGKGRARPTNG